MMQRNRWLWGVILASMILIAACTTPMIASDAKQPTAPATSMRHGIDPTLPHAQGVLMQYCTEPGCELRLIDPATGALLPDYAPITLGKYINYGLGFDGKTLATLVYPSNLFGPSSGPTDGALQLIDLQAWRAVTTTLRFNEGGGAPVFSPDGASMALAGFDYAESQSPLLHLVDIARQTQIAQIHLAFRPTRMKFTADGASILLYGNNMGVGDIQANPQVYVAQVSAADLTVEWQHILPDLRDGAYNPTGVEPHLDPEESVTWQPAVVFAPTAPRLYIVHADQNQITTVNFDSHTVRTAAIRPAQSWTEWLLALTARVVKAKVFNGASRHAVIAPDGNHLYVTGMQHDFQNNVYTETPLGVHLIDLTDNVEIVHIDSVARSLRLSPDGTQLYLHCWESDPTQPSPREWTAVVDATTLQPVTKLEQRYVVLGQRLDGQPILFSTVTLPDGQWEASTFDPVSLAVIGEWRQPQEEGWGWFVTTN